MDYNYIIEIIEKFLESYYYFQDSNISLNNFLYFNTEIMSYREIGKRENAIYLEHIKHYHSTGQLSNSSTTNRSH